MKLIYCTHCRDIVKLTLERRSCSCGRSSGMYYEDGLHANIIGDAVPLGITNESFLSALANRPAAGMGVEFTAFVIPVKCDTVKKLG